MTELPEEIRKAIAPGEHALWWGRPRQGLVLRGSDVFAIPFSLLWCGFAIFWESSVLSSSKAPILFDLWGIPFILIGLHMVVGRFFVDSSQRAHTFYAVTPERVLIVSGIFSRQVKSLSLRTLSDVSLTERRSGEGTIVFGPEGRFGSGFGGMQGMPGTNKQQAPRFEFIAAAKSVYDIVRQAQRNAA